MQIIIPMSGIGERFLRAGYKEPKFLISVEGKPIIAHVIDLFPGETDFHFICNEENLSDPSLNLMGILSKLCPTGEVHSIPSHKLGPIHAINLIKGRLDLNKPTIVNYCDFSCVWDWKDFISYVKSVECYGAIPAYRGFHPHSLGPTNYAYIQDRDGIILDIQEKSPFTLDKSQEYASSGTYYFSSADLMLKAFDYVKQNNLQINSEYYVSMAFKYLIENNLTSVVYPIKYFMQWGTPEDFEEYKYWSNAFRQIHNSLATKSSKIIDGTLVMLMAGKGERFMNEGYSDPKPLVEVNGIPMVLQALNFLPKFKETEFVVRKDLFNYEKLNKLLRLKMPQARICEIARATTGQAISAKIGISEQIQYVPSTKYLSMTIAACDCGVVFDENKLLNLLESEEADVIVWSVKGYPNALKNPEMYGWLEENNGQVTKVIEKRGPSENKLSSTPIILGIFSFSNARIALKSIDSLISRDGKINGEFYLDSSINDAISAGYRVKILEVDSFLCWGTPNDLKTFCYWQTCFDVWNSHPYKLIKAN